MDFWTARGDPFFAEPICHTASSFVSLRLPIWAQSSGVSLCSAVRSFAAFLLRAPAAHLIVTFVHTPYLQMA